MKLKLKINTLDGKWHDRDEILIHACFQCLVDFIEKEKPDTHINWDSDKEHKHAWKELTSLYKWWKEIRPTRKDPIYDENIKSPEWEFEAIPNSTYSRLKPYNKKKYKAWDKACEESRRLDVEWNKEDTNNLIRLIKIRRYMWT
jgi:hypothetical protein